MFSERGQIMPGPPVPHPRMLGFPDAHTPALRQPGSGAAWCKGLCLPSPRHLAAPAHSEELWLRGLGRKRRNTLSRRARADVLCRTRRLWDHRGHPPMTWRVSLTELPGHSHAQQLVAQLGSTSKLSPQGSLRLSDMGAHSRMPLHVQLCLQQDRAQICIRCCWAGTVTLETPGLSFHGAPGYGADHKFLRVSEGEMLWETPPHSNNPTREGLPRRSRMMPEQRIGRSHLTSIPIDTYASGSSLSTPSNLTPQPSSFSTPTLLHTHNSLSSTCHNMQPGCTDKPTPQHSLLLASPEKEALFRPLLLGYKPSRAPAPDLPSCLVSRGALGLVALTCTGTLLRRAAWLCQACASSPELFCN